jgi:hypothetical protein
MKRRILLSLVGVLLCGVAGAVPQARQAAGRITTPIVQFGHNFGDDYFLANYQQISAYWKKLATQSPRIVVQSIGKTAYQRDQLMAIVTSPENHKALARYKDISARLARAEGLTDDQARALAKEGKTVVWIDGGLHATETLGAQQLGEMVYRMVSRTDDETMRILNDVIILFVHANPDGNDLVADWYMRNPDPAQRSAGGLPELYQKYIGHDNNRDFFASTQVETENMNRVLYREWYPQLLYNHHQSGPPGTILYSPPLRDPFNYNEDPLVVLGIQTIGTALHTRLAAEGKPGATMRSGGSYDGWWNGGLRNTAAFHNTIAILTEMIGDPTPMRVSLSLDRQLPTSDLAYPVPPQEWHFRQSIEYSVSCNLALLDIASRMKDNFLYNRYVMGKRAIARGSEDTWTPRPHRFAAIQAEVARGAGAAPPAAGAGAGGAGGGAAGGGRGGRGAGNADALWAALHKPADRDPRAFILPAGQPDFPTATKFINALLETGITVHRATKEFTAAGKTYPAGSYVVFTAQAFRPHVMDMFEPQDHPDNFAYTGAPPTHPYDNAGWTLAYQMGVEFDRILDGFTGPFEKVADWNLKPPAPNVSWNDNRFLDGAVRGLYLSRDQLDSFTVVNRLLREKPSLEISVLTESVIDLGRTFPVGTWRVGTNVDDQSALSRVAATLGVTSGWAMSSDAKVQKLVRPRIGLWDRYGGSMDAGWARWILEQFEFTFDRVFAPELDAGNLNAKYDTLIFVTGALPGGGGGGAGGAGGGGGRGGGGAGAGGGAAQNVPAQYAGQQGAVTADRTMPQVKQFIENGGTVIAIGTSATNLARYLDLPVTNHLVENGQPIPQTKYYVPGSVLRAHVDTTRPAAAGMKADTDFFFDNSPVWTLGPDAAARGVKPIAWFDSKTPLRSGWAWGQAYLDGGVIAVDATVGKGKVLLFGAEILQRGQPHGTFKLLFNGIYAK